jgi:hypothetical protein
MAGELPRIWSAVLVHTNGLGSWFHASIQAVRSASNSATLRCAEPKRGAGARAAASAAAVNTPSSVGWALGMLPGGWVPVPEAGGGTVAGRCSSSGAASTAATTALPASSRRGRILPAVRGARRRVGCGWSVAASAAITASSPRTRGLDGFWFGLRGVGGDAADQVKLVVVHAGSILPGGADCRGSGGSVSARPSWRRRRWWARWRRERTVPVGTPSARAIPA